MRIAQLASLVESVPPVGYGGTELVVSLLTEELVYRGHEVTLFASGDSITKAELISILPKALRTSTNIPQNRWMAYDLCALLELEKRQTSFDIIHNHMGYQSLPYLRNLCCPVVSTNHNLVKDYCAPIYLACRHLPYVSISQAYRQLNYPELLNYVATIYNGIDAQAYTYNAATTRSYLLFIGRVCPDKGTAEAIEISRKLRLPLKIAGKIDPDHEEYFKTKIQPHLKLPDFEYLGEVNFTQKVDLLSKAIAVVYPITFNEPFGLVMVEALASGTPVMALARGSVSEVLSDGETAVIARSLEELVRRYPEIERISPDACKQRALKYFSKERMVDEYEKLYANLLRA